MVLRGRSALALADRAAKSCCPFCSPAHEIISVLFRAGTVTPCDLGHCGITPLNVLCLKALGKKQVFLVTGALSISYWAFQLVALPMRPLENFLQLSGDYNSAAAPGGLLCWESLQSRLSPQDLLHQGLVLYLPPLKIVQIWVFLLACSCRIGFSPEESVFCYQILSSLWRITRMASHHCFYRYMLAFLKPACVIVLLVAWVKGI